MRSQVRSFSIVRICCIAVLVFTMAVVTACGKESGDLPETKTAAVERGDLTITVPADGIIQMPRQVELGFGTTGAVAEVLVEEGDFVHEGTLLARLDNTSQKNAIISALYDMQQARNTLEKSCGNRGVQYTYNYPDITASRIFKESLSDLDSSYEFLTLGYYKEACSKLRMVNYQLEICVDLLQAQLKAIETYPLTPAITTYENRPDIPDRQQEFLKIQETRRRLLQDEKNLNHIHASISAGNFQEAIGGLDKELMHMQTSQQYVNTTIGQKSRNNITYPDTATCTDFLDSCKNNLADLIERAENGDYDPISFAESLRMAILDLQIGTDTLTSSTIIYESGMNLLEVQQYNLELLSAELAFMEAKNNLTKTEILAPFDGEVVDIGVEVDNVLSSVDYSSRTAVTLLDTGTVEFAGTIDEVDIFDVEVGQKASIIIDAMPDKQIAGTVNFISPFGSNERGVVTFDMTAQLDPTDLDLRGGLTATADILVTSRKDVLLIPSKAVVESPMGTMAIVVTPGTEERKPTPITLGKDDYQYTEVVSGLEEGQTVLIIEEAILQNVTSGGGRPPMGPPPGARGGPLR